MSDLFVHDLDIRLTTWPSSDGGADVHRGFAKRTDLLLRTHDSMLQDSDSLVFAGHSLGGACAVLAASRMLAMRGSNVKAVYTFGAPKLATTEFTRLYKHRQNLDTVTCNFATTFDPVVNNLPNYGLVEVSPYLRLPCKHKGMKAHDMHVYCESLVLLGF